MSIDGVVQTALKGVLDVALTATGINALVVQDYNPTTQGAPLTPVVLFTKISAVRFGWQGRKYVYNMGPPDDFTKTESWFLKATYQLTGFMNQNAVDPNSLNAYDVLDFCAGILQTLETRATLLIAGIGVQRITDIRTPSKRDDSDRFIIEPSFDVVLVYKNELTSTVPAATVTGTVTRV